MNNRRKEDRFPVLHEIDEPIELAMNKEIVPGVLVDLSATGMCILTFATIAIGTDISMTVNLPGFKSKPMAGKVVWSINKGEMVRTGIAFNSIDPIDFRHINRMGFDFTDCDTKIELGAQDVCFEKCSYYALCTKDQKLSKNSHPHV
jgi:hypothetical protein